MSKRSSKSDLRADRRIPPPPEGARSRAGKAPKQRAAARRGLLRRILMFPLRLLWAISWRIGLVGGLILAVAVLYTVRGLPNMEDLVDARARGSVTILDHNAQVFAWRGEQFGGQITANSVSPHLKHAVVATEDKRFYWHLGISPRGIASAIRINLRNGRGALQGNGGSTITQQTAKLLCLGVPYDRDVWGSEAAYEKDCRRTTLWRKAKEAVYALALELRFSKDEILTIYLTARFWARAHAGSKQLRSAILGCLRRR